MSVAPRWFVGTLMIVVPSPSIAPCANGAGAWVAGGCGPAGDVVSHSALAKTIQAIRMRGTPTTSTLASSSDTR